MGKEDEKNTNKAIQSAQNQSDQQYNQNTSSVRGRLAELESEDPQGQRSNIVSQYQKYAATGGIDQGLYDKLNTTSRYNQPITTTTSSGVPGGSPITTTRYNNRPSYLNTFDELSATGGARAANYNDTNASIQGLQNQDMSSVQDISSKLKDFAATGGLTSEDSANINRQSLLDFESTGGYSADDISNIRNRGNSTVPSYFSNLKRGIDRQRLVSGQGGPGLTESNFALARQASQAQADQVRDTELGINDRVRANKLDTGKFLSDQNLNLTGLRTGNVLSGYNSAGNLESNLLNQKSTNLANAGSLSLSREGQLDSANQAANANRLSATGALTADDLARTNLDSENTRFLTSSKQAGILSGIQGLADMYGMSRDEALQLQNILLQYYGGQGSQNTALINQRVNNAANTPGLMDDIGKGLSIGSKITGGISGALG